MNLELLRELRDQINVAHHIPGRIRLKFGYKLARHPRAKELADTKETPPGVTSLRINLMACSMVMEYDTARLTPATLDDFFTSKDPERFALACQALETLFGSYDHLLDGPAE